MVQMGKYMEAVVDSDVSFWSRRSLGVHDPPRRRSQRGSTEQKSKVQVVLMQQHQLVPLNEAPVPSARVWYNPGLY